MGTILTTTEIVVNFLILLFIVRLTLDPREFFFNAVLRPVDQVTQPLLKPLKTIFRPTQSGWDYSPLIAILLLVVIQTVIIFWMKGLAILLSFLQCSVNIFGFLIQFITVCVVITLLVPVYTGNPLSKFFMKVLEPFIKVFSFLAQKRSTRITVAFVGLLILSVLLWHGILVLYHNALPVKNSVQDVKQAFLQTRHVDASVSIRSGYAFLFASVMVLIKVIKTYQFMVLLLVINCVLSWINLDTRNPVAQFVFSITEPILTPVRRYIPTAGGLDFSPVIVILLLSVIGRTISGVLTTLIFG